MEFIGAASHDLLSDPRMEVHLRQHHLLPSYHLKVRFQNGLGVSVIPEPWETLDRRQLPMVPGSGHYELSFVEFYGSGWQDFHVVDIDVYQFLSKEEVFELMSIAESLPADFFHKENQHLANQLNSYVRSRLPTLGRPRAAHCGLQQ